jgi:hypothetical protein
MILNNKLTYLLIVSTSKISMNRKKTLDNDQNVSSLKLQIFDSLEDQPLEFSTKRTKMDRNLTPESSNFSNDLNLNLNDKK